MTKESILNHPAWKYISSLRNSERYGVLFGGMRPQIEKEFSVKIEEKPYTSLSEINNEWVAISCTDTIRNISLLAVLVPNNSTKDKTL